MGISLRWVWRQEATDTALVEGRVQPPADDEQSGFPCRQGRAVARVMHLGVGLGPGCCVAEQNTGCAEGCTFVS